MKKNLLKALLFTACLSGVAPSVNAQVGEGYWSFSNPKPFGFSITSTSFADDNNGLMVGYQGGVAKTTDGGGTWAYFAYKFKNASNVVTKAAFQDVQFLNATTAFAVGDQGVCIKSIDGGTNWTFVNTPFFAGAQTINTVYFLNPSFGVIAGEPVDGLTSVYFTQNGGASWTHAAGLPEEGRTILKVRFNANGIGYITGANNEKYGDPDMNSLIWKYVASTNTWTNYSVYETTKFDNVNATDTSIVEDGWDDDNLPDTIVSTYADDVDALNASSWRGIAIVDDTVVVIGAQNNGQLIRLNTSTAAGIYKLINNNVTNPRFNALGGASFYNLAIRDGNTIAATAYNKLAVSTDKGLSWALKPVYPEGSNAGNLQFYGVDITPGKRFVVGGASGVIADSLSSWRTPYITYKGGGGGFGGGGGVQIIKFLDADNGIAAGSGGAMLVTKNGGDSWEDKSTPGFNFLERYTDIAYLAADDINVTTSLGGFYKFIDQGETYDLLFTEPYSGGLVGLNFPTKLKGFMVANEEVYDIDGNLQFLHKVVYTTNDGGYTWDSVANAFPTFTDYASNEAAGDMKFLNDKVGYLVGGKGTIFKTIDGGLSWSKKTNVPEMVLTTDFKSVAIVDDKIAYASASMGVIVKTTDGGETWVLANNGLPMLFQGFPKLLAYDASQVMAFGSGEVYTTKDGGNSWSAYYAPLGQFGFIGGASFAPMKDCNSGVCQKVFVAVSNNNILKFDADRILPIKFSNLSASPTAQGNQLFWTSFSQKEVRDFVIEGSTDGTSFAAISGRLSTDGQSYQSHSWLHANAPTGKYYYRVKATEKDGAIFYTNVVSLSSIKAAGWKHQLSNGTLILNNPQVKTGSVTVQVVNAAGQIVAAKAWNQVSGSFNNLLLLPPTTHGVHYVKLINEGTVYSAKVMIQ